MAEKKVEIVYKRKTKTVTFTLHKAVADRLEKYKTDEAKNLSAFLTQIIHEKLQAAGY